MVNGRRVKTVDVHAHCAVPAAMALMGRKLETEALLMTDTHQRLRAMDAQGIDVEALSINPYWYDCARDQAAELIKVQNAGLAEICAALPERFVAYATRRAVYWVSNTLVLGLTNRQMLAIAASLRPIGR